MVWIVQREKSPYRSFAATFCTKTKFLDQGWPISVVISPYPLSQPGQNPPIFSGCINLSLHNKTSQ